MKIIKTVPKVCFETGINIYPRYHSNCAVMRHLRLYQALCINAAVTGNTT